MLDATSHGYDLDLFPEARHNINGPQDAPDDQGRDDQGWVNALRMEAMAPVQDQLRQPRHRDPFVIVPRYMDHVPDVLVTEEFKQELVNHYPVQAFDNLCQAVAHYLAVREYVYNTLQDLDLRGTLES